MNLLKKIKNNTKIYAMSLILIVCIESQSRPSLNDVSAYTIDREIKGVGEIKSTKIINERETNGNYKNIQDFIERTHGFVGEKVQTRIVRTYKI